MINLTAQERDKFSTWLEQEAESDRLMLEQMKKLPHTEPMQKKLKAKIASCIIISGELNAVEEMTI